MTVHEYIWHTVFFILVFGVPIFLAWASASEMRYVKTIDVSSLWVSHENGKVDTMLVIVIGTWWVHTCAAIMWILTKNFTDANVIQYMGWALPIVASWITRRAQAVPVKAGDA